MRNNRFIVLSIATTVLSFCAPLVSAQICDADPQNYIDTSTFTSETTLPVVYDGTVGLQYVYDAQPLGDYDGDGIADMLLAIRTSDEPQGNLFSQAAVVYGSASNTRIDLHEIYNGDGSRGFFIAIEPNQGVFDRLIPNAAGDVNGDGLADIVLGANDRGPGGEVYVVYGSNSRSNSQVYTSNLATGDGSQGFVIRAANSGDNIGTTAAGIGDFNGDGNVDIAISASGVSNAPTGEGAAYVYFGQGAAQPVVTDLSEIHNGDTTQGVMFYGAEPGFTAGTGVRAAGDVNNDGIGDVLIGARNSTLARTHTYVAFGSANSTGLELNTLSGADGFRIQSTTANPVAGLGYGIGDYNNDGYDDLAVSLTDFQAGEGNPGTVFLILGRGDNTLAGLDLDTLTDGSGSLGVTLTTCDIDPTSALGSARGIGGDFNGDGIDDFIVRARRKNGDAVFEERIHVVYGVDDIALTDVDLDSLRENGLGEIYQSRFRSAYDFNSPIYRAEAGVGDFNNDGFADIIAGVQDNSTTDISEIAIGIFGGSNRPPSIETIPTLVPYANREISYEVQIFDPETDASDLQLSATSTDPDKVRDSNITFSGTGRMRTMTIKAGIALGETIISVSVSDADGKTTTLPFDVFVANFQNDDGAPPEITLTGAATQTIAVGGTYNEQGASATDTNLGDVSEYIVIDASAVDTDTIGTYTVTYNVSDEFGNAATEAVRTVSVAAAAPSPPPAPGNGGGGGSVNLLALFTLLLLRLSKTRTIGPRQSR